MNTTIKTLALFIATFSSFSTLAINYSNVNYQDIESLRSALNNVVNSHSSRDAARAALNKMSPDSLEQAKLSIKDPQVRNVMDQLLEGVPENRGSLQAPNTKTTAVITSDASTPINKADIDNSSNPHALNPNAIAQVTVSNQGWTQNNYRQGYDSWSGDVQSTRPAVSASQMKMDASTAQQNTISENKQNAVAQLDQRDAVSRRLSAQAKEQITHNLRFNNLTASKLEGQIQQADRENSEHEAAIKGEALTKANQQRTRQQVLAGGVAEVNAEMQREAEIKGVALAQSNRDRVEAENTALNAARTASLVQHEAAAAETAHLAAQKSQAADKAQREAQQAQAALTSAKYAGVSEGQAQQAMRDLTAAKYVAVSDNIQIAHEQIQALEAEVSAKSSAAAKAQTEAKAAALAAQNALKTPVVGQPTPVSIVPAVVTNIPTPVIAKVFLTEGSHNNGGQHKGPHQNAASTRNNGNSNAHGSAMGGRGLGGQRSGHSAAGNF